MTDITKIEDPAGYYSMPNGKTVEIFYIGKMEAKANEWGNQEQFTGPSAPGWYWWNCVPGWIPEDEPSGPFTTPEEAYDDAS